MSRAIPLDELLLQLAESLKKSLRLTAAEVWTASDGSLELAASVPHRHPPRIHLTAEELPVVTQSHVSGNGWAQIWLRQVVDDHPGEVLRVVPMAHSGELVGLLVCTRLPTDSPFNEEEDRVLGELARQVALALHNSRLDSALAASLDDLRNVNSELAASRARVVTAADESRRKIERNLHDGAQQHLVALAVKVGLVKKLMTMDPDTANELLDELRGDVQNTLTELRELAHGIYPPLLRDRGLPEALQAAANRAVQPTTVEAQRRPALAGARGRRLLLLPRGDPERRQVRRCRTRRSPSRSTRSTTRSSSPCATPARASTRPPTSRSSATASSTWPTASARSAAASRSTSAIDVGTAITGRIPLGATSPVAPVPSPVVAAGDPTSPTPGSPPPVWAGRVSGEARAGCRTRQPMLSKWLDGRLRPEGFGRDRLSRRRPRFGRSRRFVPKPPRRCSGPTTASGSGRTQGRTVPTRRAQALGRRWTRPGRGRRGRSPPCGCSRSRRSPSRRSAGR